MAGGTTVASTTSPGRTDGTSGADSTEGPPPTTGSETSSGPPPDTSGNTSTTTTSGDGSTTEDEGTTTTGAMPSCEPTNPGGNMVCNDGNVVAGELCYQTQPPLLTAGTLGARVLAADLDDDLDPDVLALVEFPAALTVMLNQGGGALVLDDTYVLSPELIIGSVGVDIGDMDGDTYVDAVVASVDPPSLLVMCNDGGGAFGFPIVTMLPVAPTALGVADIDGNGTHDVVVVQDGGLIVHYGQGNGMFGMVDFVANPLGGGRNVVIEDLDDDGDLDVAAAFRQSASVFLNDAGTLQLPIDTPVATTMAGPDDIDVGDVTGDGILDLVVADRTGNIVQLLAGVGDGTFVADPVTVPGSQAVVGDANADCYDDVLSLTTPLQTDELTIYPGDGMGSLAAPQTFSLHSGMVDMDGADFDGDGLIDLVYMLAPTGEVGVSLTEP